MDASEVHPASPGDCPSVVYKIGVTFVMDGKDRVKEIVIQKPAR